MHLCKVHFDDGDRHMNTIAISVDDFKLLPDNVDYYQLWNQARLFV